MQLTKRGVILTNNEKASVMKAHDIMAEKFAASGESYDYTKREMVECWLYGALYTSGVDGMMKCVTEAKIAKKRRATA